MSQARPDLSAFIVVLAQLAVRKVPHWAALVPDENLPALQALADEATSRDGLMKLIAKLPNGLKLALADQIICFGYALHIALRKQVFEVQARSDVTKGAQQVVVLGSGFDTLAWRLAREFPSIQSFEIDLPGMQEIKAEGLARCGMTRPENLHSITANLRQSGLEELLGKHPSFRRGVPTLFIMEGLTMYFEEERVGELIRSMRLLGGDDVRLLFTAIENTGSTGQVSGVLRDGLLTRKSGRFRWGLSHTLMGGYLKQQGFALVHDREYQDMQRAYRAPAQMKALDNAPGEHIYYARAASV